MEKAPKIEKTKNLKKAGSKILLGAAILGTSFSPVRESENIPGKTKRASSKDSQKIEASAPVKKERKSKKNISFEEAQSIASMNQGETLEQAAIEAIAPEEKTSTEGQIESKKEITVPFDTFIGAIRDSIAKHSEGEISVKTFEIKKEGDSFNIKADLKAWGFFTINLSGKIINSIKATPGGTAYKTLEIIDIKIDASRLIRNKAEEMVKTNITFAIPFLKDQLRTQYQTSFREMEIDASGNLKLTE